MTPITAALEDYLEAILIIEKNRKVVRVKDLAGFMNVKAPSVNEALENLKKRGFIDHERYGHVELTAIGLSLAQKIYKRHNALKKFFHEILGVCENIAEEDACKVEHYLSKETIERILEFIEPQGKKG